MKAKTTVVMGIRHVGRSEENSIMFMGSLAEALVEVAKYMTRVDMAKRVEIVFGRSEDEIRRAWEPYQRQGGQKVASDSMVDEMARIMAEFGVDAKD